VTTKKMSREKWAPGVFFCVRSEGLERSKRKRTGEDVCLGPCAGAVKAR